MPLYTFMNKDTDEVFTEMMSISQREEYLSQNFKYLPNRL